MIPAEWLVHAQSVLAEWAERTPVTLDPELQVYFKWENQQLTGSFKLRGAFNKIASLLPWERERGLVTASAGNHGMGVAYAAREMGAKAVIFASEHAVANKVRAMRDLGAEVRLVTGGYTEAEAAGLIYSHETGLTWVSPYNDGRVIAGQATIGLELAEQIRPFDPQSVVVPVGGGGLISGVALALRSKEIKARIIGVQSEATAVMHAVFNGRPQEAVVEAPSLADGLSGQIERGSMTIPLVQELVDEIILVSEPSIEAAIVYAWEKYNQIIEGSAAVVLAAVLTGKIAPLPAALVISGGNIQPEVHQSLIARGSGKLQRAGSQI
ncbi:MAG: threonine ammonia-lyase [Bellilinea sp.]